MQTKAVAADLYPNHTVSSEKNQHFKLNDRMKTANLLYLHMTFPPGLRIWQRIHTQHKVTSKSQHKQLQFHVVLIPSSHSWKILH
jgi:hypothetical protein